MRLAGAAAALNGSKAEARAQLQRLLALGLPDGDFALHSLESLELQIGTAELLARGRAMLLAALAESSGRCE